MREYDLSGEWKFGLEPDLLNDVIMLPGTMAQAHKGEKNNKRATEGKITILYDSTENYADESITNKFKWEN